MEGVLQVLRVVGVVEMETATVSVIVVRAVMVAGVVMKEARG